jgi:hypothetical protein
VRCTRKAQVDEVPAGRTTRQLRDDGGPTGCGAWRAAVTLTVLELFDSFDSAMKVSTPTINVMVCAPGLVGSSRTDCCH